jgi:hypothetical protein
VTYAGLPGYAKDWIAIAPAGAPATTFVAWAYTGGQTSGAATFAAPLPAGSYVARAFPNDTYTPLVESAAFTVTAPITNYTIATDQSSYAAGGSVTVTYGGLPGYPRDWIAIAPAGSSATTFVAWAYTGGQASGTATLKAPLQAGSYVARAFPNDTYTPLVESAAFTVTAPITNYTIATDQSSYAAGGSVTVTYGGLPGYAKDWIAIAPAGSSATTFLAWVYTGGQTSGTATFKGPLQGGSYVARAFPNDTYTPLVESAAFTVTAPITNYTIATDQSSYAAGGAVTVTYGGLPGYARDWIAIAPAGSSATTFLAWAYTGGQTSGTASLKAPLQAGSYVARAFPNDTYTLLIESTSFTVTP